MKTTPRVCPECQHVFQGNGWDGVDAHWRSKHENVMRYEKAWPLLKTGRYVAAALLLSSLTSGPADAACHHYSRWYYPWPQPHCGAGLASHTTREADHSWYVEFVLPDPDPDLDRARGLAELKEKLK